MTLGYSLQSNRKTKEGEDHPGRDAQFRHINLKVKRCLKLGVPVISVDTKKKALIGNDHHSASMAENGERTFGRLGGNFTSAILAKGVGFQLA